MLVTGDFMADIQIATFSNTVLSNGSYVLFDKPQYGFTKKVTLEGDLTIHLNGLCTGNVSTAFPLNGTFEISNQTNKMTKNFSFVNKCSRVDGTFILTLSEHSSTQFKLACEITYEKQGQTFSVASVQSGVKITGVKMEVQEFTLSYPAVPDHVSYSISRSFSLGGNTGQLIANPSSSGSLKLYYGDSISISANADENYADPTFYLNQSGTTSIASVTENVTAVVQSNGLKQYPITLIAAPNTEIYLYTSDYVEYGSPCDACYCYCDDGSEIVDGEYCTEYREYHYTQSAANIGKHLQIRTSAQNGKKVVSTIINGVVYPGAVDTEIVVNEPLVVSTVLGHTLTLNAADGTTINVTDASGQSFSNGATIVDGTTLTLTAVPTLSNYTVTGLLLNGNQAQGNSVTVTVTDDLTVETTSVGTFTLSVSQGANTLVSVTRNGSELTNGDNIFSGDVLLITASANTGFWINSFKINSQTFSGNRTVTHVVDGYVNVITTAVACTTVNLNLDNGASIIMEKEIYPPYPPECDGGCYCWCNGEDYGYGTTECPGKYETIGAESVILPGDVIVLKPRVSSGHDFEFFVVNGQVYDTLRNIKLTAGSVLDIGIYTDSDNWQTVASSLTLTGSGTGDVVQTINGLVKDKPTKIKITSGYYKSSEMQNVPATDCDGCYCHCSDGSEVYDGDYCYELQTNYNTISSGLYMFSDNSLFLANKSDTSKKLEISDNTIVFKGYDTRYETKSKNLVIEKISQYNG